MSNPAFAEKVLKRGDQPMLYGSKNVIETIWIEKLKMRIRIFNIRKNGKTFDRYRRGIFI